MKSATTSPSRERRRRAVDDRWRWACSRARRPSTPAGRLAIDGCDLEALAREHGTPLYVYSETELRARAPRVPRRVRCRRGVVRGEGVPLHARWRAWSPTRGCTSTSPPAASSRSRSHAGFPAARVVFHGNNKSDAELRLALDAGVGRIVADSFDELDRIEALVAAGAPVAARAGAGHAGRRGAHPRVHRHRRRRLEVRLHGVERQRPRRRAARRRSRTRCSSAGSTATSGRRSSCSSRSPAPRRSSPSSRPTSPAPPVRRCPRSTSAVVSACPTPPTSSTPRASPSSVARPAPTSPTRARRSTSIPHPRSRWRPAGRSRRPPGSRSTPSAPSRRSPACAPTSRSTAG